ncbi:MAG: hypothetical protein RLZZ546_1903 [Bacteroidota bacterium]|jgi:uncharacterized protein (DUF1501 family)
MKRRKFIQSSSLMTLPLMLKGMEVTAIAKSRLTSLVNGDNDRVLVLVQLNGGNDGLNTFIPLDQYTDLMKVRESIMIPENQILKTSDKNGFHKSMEGFKQMFDSGQMSVIQGVSYPNQNRSHFRSTDIWTSASDSEKYISSGWLGRYFDLNYKGFPEDYPNEDFPDPFAITLGFVVSDTCQGVSSNYSFTVNSEEDIKSLNETVPGEYSGLCMDNEVTFIKDVIRQTNAYSSRVLEAFNKGNNFAIYPEDNGLANQLKVVANLISGGLKTKIFVVSQGGYDTHANQVVGGDAINGTHAELLGTLSSAISAFQKDLVALGIDNKVLGMTFSEFGRRIIANDSFGTDHGTAAPVFVFGSCVNSNIFGQNADISSNVDSDEGVAMQYDFRSVYASILMDWFKSPKEDIQKILFKDFQHIPFIKDCAISTETEEILSFNATLYPNPASHYIQVNFLLPASEMTNIDIFDSRGFRVKEVLSRKIDQGENELRIDISDLYNGIFFIRVEAGNRQSSSKFVKMGF